MIHKLIILVAVSLPIYQYVPVECARILGVFPFASTSHSILGKALLRGLAEAGHDVTMISPHEEKSAPSRGSYRNIVLTGFLDAFNDMLKDVNLMENYHQSPLAVLFLQSMLHPIIENTFNHTNVKALLNSDEKFDAVIVEQFINDPLKVFAYRFDAPLILFNSLGPGSWINYIAGNPSPPSYVPNTMANLPVNMTFFQRAKNLIYCICDYLLVHFYVIPKNADLMKRYFPDAPEFSDPSHIASLILINSHESLYQAIPLVPNMIEIGGYHVSPPKRLPKDLQDYLDEAKEGVVYFSMGSNLRSKDLPPEKRDIFLRVFGKLKEKVLWKWEDEVLPGRPSNVKLGKWLPQQDILAHPNVKAFITHGGLLSSIETVYHGVPILAIPVYGDQHMNAQNAVKSGYALSLHYNDPSFSEEKLSHLLNELLNNSKYREIVKQRSKLFHDRPLKPMENAVFWVEYVIRHKGAPHLLVAGAQMPLYKYLLLDVIAFMVAITISMLYLFRIIIRCFCHRWRQSKIFKAKKE